MLDISRCRVPTQAHLLELVDLLAKLNYNQLQLYTEHTFQYQGHETVWQDSSALGSHDIQELDRYATQQGIELVPNQNSFGHFERWLKHPTYRDKYAECPDGYPCPWGGAYRDIGATLQPNDASLALLRDLYDQLLPNFKSRNFNVGCDETFELGRGASKDICEKNGRLRVYLDFLLRIADDVKSRGYTMQFWGDIIHEAPELIGELPKDIIALEWGYEADHPFEARCGDFTKHCIPFVICPGTSTWRSVLGRTDNMITNIQRAAVVGKHTGAEGMLLTDWGDLGHLQTWPFTLPALVEFAAQSHSIDNWTEDDLASEIDILTGSRGLGQWLLDAGRAHQLLECPLSNSTALFHLLLPKHHKAIEFDSPDIRKSCSAKLQNLATRLEDIHWGDQRMKPECEIMIQLALCATEGRRPSALDRALFKQCWLERSRPGGLEESLTYLS